MLAAGLVQFSAVGLEMSVIFAAAWGHIARPMHWLVLLLIVILIPVTACVSVVSVYLQLSGEDHKWWWRSFFSGGLDLSLSWTDSFANVILEVCLFTSFSTASTSIAGALCMDSYRLLCFLDIPC